jgi:hypothetical protein
MSDHAAINLGWEVGKGTPVAIPCRHMVVTGQTQEAGKTTTLEALISQSGLPAVAFVTKRGEQSFAAGRRIQPYFRERADWQFVASVLEAAMRERLKFERAWIMRASKGARTLADVHRNVRSLMATAKGLSADVYLTLDAYLEIVVPRVEKVKFAERLDLKPGLNVVDLSDRDHFPPELQSLVMRSVLEWVYERCNGTITIIPEAWEFIPQQRGSPVKLAAVELVRKGAGLRNYVWLDSQDIGGVDKELLRSCPVWLLGVQREANEVKRTLENIPAGIARPTASDLATLEKGQFYACWGRHVIKTYVQPAWMGPAEAAEIARGGKQVSHAPPAKAYQIVKPEIRKEHQVTHKEADELRAENGRLRDRIADLEALVKKDYQESAKSRGDDLLNKVTPPGDHLYEKILARLLKEPAIMELRTRKPEIRIAETREVIEVDGKTLRGRLAKLIDSGYFDEPHTASAAWTELQRLGFSTAKPNVYKECDNLAEMGFLTKEDGGYRVVVEMRSNISKR